MATKTLTVSENVSYICFPPLNAKTVKGKLAFDCPVVYLYFGFTPTFDIEPLYFGFTPTFDIEPFFDM